MEDGGGETAWLNARLNQHGLVRKAHCHAQNQEGQPQGHFCFANKSKRMNKTNFLPHTATARREVTSRNRPVVKPPSSLVAYPLNGHENPRQWPANAQQRYALTGAHPSPKEGVVRKWCVRPYATAGLVDVWFYPKHPGCRFRAFTDATTGAADYVKMVATRFVRAWPFVDAGDPRGFVHALKMQGYFTADETQYTNGLVGCYKVASQANINYAGLGDLSAADAAQVAQVVAASLDQSISESIESSGTST